MKKIFVITLAMTILFTVGCSDIPEALTGESESVNTSVAQDLIAGNSEEETSEAEDGVELLEFMPQLENYVVSIPEIDGGWTVYPEPGNEEQLVLDNSDVTFSIMVQGFPKESQAYSDFASFEEFYTAGVASSMGAGVAQEVNFTNDNILNHATYYYEAESQGYLFKGQITIFEMENGYYSCTLTGLDSIYDANIETYSCIYDNFREQ